MARPHCYIGTNELANKLALFRQCPVTCGLPTRMTREGFARLCRHHLKRQRTHALQWYAVEGRPTWCSVCQGKQVPAELELIDGPASLAYHKKKQQEQNMGKTERAQCEGCGKDKVVSMCSGQLLCPSCASLAGTVSSRLDVLTRMILNRGKGEDALAALAAQLTPDRVAVVLQPYLQEQVAINLENDTLERIAKAVGYTGESGDGLIDAVADMADALAGYREERGRHGEFLIGLREILGQATGPVGDLLKEVTRIKNMQEALQGQNEALREAIDDLRTAVDLDSAAALHELVARVQELAAVNRSNDLVSADVLRALGLEQGAQVDRATLELAILQTAAEAEDVAIDNDFLYEWMGLFASTVGMTELNSEDCLLLLKTIAHSEALLEALAMQLGTIEPADILQSVAALTQAYDRTHKQAERLASESTALAERIGELEWTNTANEQVFARLREVIDADGLSNGDLPSAVEQLLYAGGDGYKANASNPVDGRAILDSHLLELALDAMRGHITGLDPDRIAMLREVG